LWDLGVPHRKELNELTVYISIFPYLYLEGCIPWKVEYKFYLGFDCVFSVDFGGTMFTYFT